MKPIIWSSLNWFDAVIIGIIFLSVVISFFRGFLREAVSLITWVVAVLLALKFAPLLSRELATHIESHTVRYLLSFAVILIVVLIVGAIINLMIKMLVDKSGVGFIDRLLGVIFGTARGILAIGVMLMFLDVSALAAKPWYANSQLAPQFTPLVKWLESFVPEKMHEVTSWLNQGEQYMSTDKKAPPTAVSDARALLGD